jgi:UDP-N-acetylglucosamine--N-acetylmuramyl-(pentapeptide) pyrophosphoryl-undecaprenol N-acetylglucosamine transferase
MNGISHLLLKLARIYFAPYGVGLGHASRLLSVAEHLRTSGTGVRFSSFGEAVNYLAVHGYDCMQVPPMELVWSPQGSFSIKGSIASIPQLFTNFIRQLNTEMKYILSYSPDIIVSDTRLSPLFIAEILKIPSILILNQVKLLLSPRLREFRLARLYEKMNGEFLGLLWQLADRILIPDLPPPYTIAERNVWDTSTVASRLSYVGFTSPKLTVTNERLERVCHYLGLDRARPIVFFHLSGPKRTRLRILQNVLLACKSLRPQIQYIISGGTPDGDPDFKKIAANGWYFQWCPVRDEIFALSNLLVIRGGHTVISQAIQFGKPMLTIPIENHGEQIGNSEKVAKIGLGMMIPSAQINPKKIVEAVHHLLDDHSFRDRATDVMKLSSDLDGIDNIVNIIRPYLK